MPELFFTSDTHDYHKNIFKFSPNTRRGSNVEEMRQLLIDQWNSQVSPHDTVYHLGDLSFAKSSSVIEYISQLNGHIHLIRGNHDTWLNQETAVFFDSVSDIKQIKVGKQKIFMCHYPIYDWKDMRHGSYHLHGHTHGHTPIEGRIFDVGVDARTDNTMALYHYDELDTILKNKPIRKHH